MIGGEKLCEGTLSTSLLEGFISSDAAQPDCENRANREVNIKSETGVVVLGLATSHDEEIKLMQVRPAGQAGYPISLVASLDTVPVKCCVPLLSKKFYIFSDDSHTHLLTTIFANFDVECILMLTYGLSMPPE